MNRLCRTAGLMLLLAWSAKSEDSEYYKEICSSLTPTYEAAGFVCLSANARTYLRCHLPELVWKVMDCPETLRCTADVMNWTESNPCNYPPAKYCGDGVVDEGEECEIGGYGCGNDCLCELDFMPTDPAGKDCVRIPYCGDGVINNDEQCEVGGAGCNAQCMCEEGYKPTDPVSKDCMRIPYCGDGELNEGEQCEIGGAGCNANCLCEEGYVPAVPVAKDCVRLPFCGDGEVNNNEQCEIGGIGCNDQCMCEEGYTPATPAAKDCIPPRPIPKDLTALCEWFTETDDDSGYVCLEDNSTEYLRCHLTERVATMMPCPAGTRCRAPVDVYTVYNPCLWESPFPIEDYAWVYGDNARTPDVPPATCGNGVLDDGEECELGGIGCNTDCKCMPFYHPSDPVSSDCVLDYSEVCAVLFAGSGQSVNYFCPAPFLVDNSSVAVRCDLDVPTVEQCSEGLFCTEIGGFDANPCAQREINKCGNGEINYDEQCELGGVGCNAECKCAEGYHPTSPAGIDCVLDDADSAAVLCELFNRTGYFCERYWTDETSNQFVMCNEGAYASNFACPLGTVCGRADFTQMNPCVLEGACGNGLLEEEEECEGGYGCSGCKCLPGFVPTDPVSANCKLANVTDICRDNNAWVSGESYFGCIPDLSGYYVWCDADASVAIVQLCPKGTECRVGSFTTEDPCM